MLETLETLIDLGVTDVFVKAGENTAVFLDALKSMFGIIIILILINMIVITFIIITIIS